MKHEVSEVIAVVEQTKIDDPCWKVLVVDDRFSVQKATGLLLKKMSYAGRGFKILESYTINETKQILMSNDDIALLILDVHLEGVDVGLMLLNFVRTELQNENTRVILRTGYPTSFPEKSITKKYHIDGCLFEEETSFSKLEFEIIGAIQTYRKMLSINEYLERFAGSVAFEIKNSLNMFGLNFSAIKNELFHQKIKYPNTTTDSIVNIINRGLHFSNRSDMIVDLMLKNIKNESINKSDFKVINMGRVVSQAFEDFAYTNIDRKEKVELDLKQDFEFLGDENSFVYVLFNLFKNALFYLVNKPDGKIQIRLEKGDDSNMLYFKDNGIGIPEDELFGVFEGYRSFSFTEGRGLGLAFCKRIMRNFGGDVTCQSDYGEWTQFVLAFPKVS